MRTYARLPRILLFLCAPAAVTPTLLKCQDLTGDRLTYASLTIRPSLSGDVEFGVTVAGPAQVDFPSLAEKYLHCDWSPSQPAVYPTTGACRHLLRASNGAVSGRLALAPLVVALHGAGVQTVALMVTVPRRPAILELRTAGAWLKVIEGTYDFTSRSFAGLPPPVEVRKLPPPSLAWLAIPWIAILLIPAAAALASRRIEGWAQHRVVSMSWLNAGIWLLWLTALPPGQIADFLAWHGVRSVGLQLAAVVLAFCAPPLIATAICLFILAHRTAPDEEQSVRRLLARSLLPEAAFALFYGGPVAGIALTAQHMMAVLGGFAIGMPSGFAALWLSKRVRAGSVKPIESGRLRERVVEFAGRAGTSVRSISVLWNWSRSEANAAAWHRARAIFITDSLLRAVTKREADALLAHEVGHLRDRPWVVPPKMCCTFTIVYTAGYAFLIAGADAWAEHLIAPLAFGVLLFSLSRLRHREYRADQWSAYVTQDPMALMAGLGRIAKLHDVALDWGTLAGSIMTHPPLRKRICAVARNCQIPESRALAILEDPESALAGAPAAAPYDPAVECAPADRAFSRTRKLRQAGRMFLAFPAMLMVLAFALAASEGMMLKDERMWPAGYLAFALGMPLVAGLAAQVVAWSHRRFLKHAKEDVSRSLPREFEGEMIGLVPGADLVPTEGFYAWDLGRLGAAGGRLVYLGERASFSVAKETILSMEPVHRRHGLRRARALRIQTETGAFLVVDPVNVLSRRGAKKLEQIFASWWAKDTASNSAPPPFELPPQNLPTMTQALPAGGAPAVLARILLLQLAAGGALYLTLPDNALNLIAAVTVPLLYCLVVVRSRTQSV